MLSRRLRSDVWRKAAGVAADRLVVVSGGRWREQEWESGYSMGRTCVGCWDPFRKALVEFVFDPMTDELQIREQRCA
jgi:hypothetical protein